MLRNALWACLVLPLAATDAGADVLRVRAGGAGGDGASWGAAIPSLQAALAKARAGDEIWVAAGTHLPTQGSDRSASFVLKENVALYGGFAGNEQERKERNWRANRTVLSGDIGRKGYALDNAYHVVQGADGARLDGFVVRDGYAHGKPQAAKKKSTDAKALPRQAKSPSNCRSLSASAKKLFAWSPPKTTGRGGLSSMRERRSAGTQHTTPFAILSQGVGSMAGGGIVNFQTSPVIANTVIVANVAGKGAGMYNAGGATPYIVNTEFRDNVAFMRGGGMSNDLRSSPVMKNVRFIANRCYGKGGGIYNDFSSAPRIGNGLFVRNHAMRGGAIGNDGGSSPILMRVTIAMNTADDLGAGLYNGSYGYGRGGANAPVLHRSIVWGNKVESGPGEISDWHESEAVVCESIVKGGYPGTRVRKTDPLFGNPAEDDFASPTKLGYRGKAP